MTNLLRWLSIAPFLSLGVLASAAGPADSAPPAKPALPPISAIKAEPANLTLEDGRDARRVLVWGQTSAGDWIDLTGEASFKTESPNVEVGSDQYIQPRNNGEGSVEISAGGQKTHLPVAVRKATAPPIQFVREVMPVLSKVGCNAGTCHGSAKGKNGFKLSLRGYDSEFDYNALVNDISGRRFNRVVADQSLMLLKPTAEVPHEGGQALKPGSRYYHILKQWIMEGLQSELPSARADKVECLPKEIQIPLPGMTQQVIVLAHYPDGSIRDVTREAVVTSSNTEVASVGEGGVLSAIRRGEGAVLIRYEGNYATAPMTVMGDRSGYQWAAPAEVNYIDKLVDSKLRKMKILPAELSSDADFVRRVWLDLTGLPPTPERAKAFLADASPSAAKREKLIDELLGSKDYIEFWTNKWADLLQCNSANLGEKGVWIFRNWIRDSIAKNKPYDQFVRDLLLAEGSAYKNPAANYYRVLRETPKMTEDVSQTFLGVRFTCAKCHDHPFERWTQNQYYQFSAYFARVGVKSGQLPGEEVVFRKYDENDLEVKHPKTNMEVAPKVPFGQTEDVSKAADRRPAFVEWLASKDNPMFARAISNRVWSYFFGRGIIDPVDDIRSSNPASNPELLDALTDDFVKGGFDLRKLMRAICLSRTYQSSLVTNKWNEDDKINFSHALPRRLSAEQLMDAIAAVTETHPKLAGVPQGMRAAEIADGPVAGDDFLSLFGRPSRRSSCECERTANLTLSHAMNLINGDTVGAALNQPDNRIAKLVKSEADDKKLVEEIYFAVLNRPPTEKEITSVNLAQAPTRLEGAQDLAWALMNSPAFLFNH